MKTLMDLFRRKPEAAAQDGASSPADAILPGLLADLACGDAAEMEPERRLQILNDAEEAIKAALRNGVSTETQEKCFAISEALFACRSVNGLLSR